MGILFSSVYSIGAETVEEYCNRGMAQHKQRNFAQAILDYTKAIEINPKYAQALLYSFNAQ
jgi:Tfp pilus assembly protein PilF